MKASNGLSSESQDSVLFCQSEPAKNSEVACWTDDTHLYCAECVESFIATYEFGTPVSKTDGTYLEPIRPPYDGEGYSNGECISCGTPLKVPDGVAKDWV